MAPVVAEDGKISGIIYPPPEVRNIVDKTASFVARNGPEFEHRIKQNEVNNPKFNFLNAGDPYHAYYQYKVREIRDGKPVPEAKEAAPAPPTPQSGPPALTTAKADAVKQRQTDLLKSVQKQQEPPPPKDPPAEFEFIADPPSISAFDLDVVKLTAQFVARNGRQFLTNLMNREQRNYQFDFLRPQHSLFQYFTKLLEQYTKVLIPPKDVMKKLEDESKNEKAIRDQVKYRVAWIKHQEAKKRREEEEAERERIAYAQIDWHSFVVVETVDYQPWEVGNFPPPTNATEVGARVLMQRRVETGPTTDKDKSEKSSGAKSGANLEVEDMEEESSSDEYESDDETADVSKPPEALGKPVMAVDAAPAVMQPPPTLPAPDKVEVRKYDPKSASAAKKKPEVEEFLVSPITGEKIPASKVQEHMRIGLLDPRWVEERDKQITARASEQQVFAPGQAIESSLKHLAERRTDIFGVGEEAAQEAAIGMKMGEEERRQTDDKVQWDGHTSTAEATARAARANITLNDQIEQIHRAKGLIPDSSKESIGPKVTKPPQLVPPAPPASKPAVQAAPPQPVRPPQVNPPVTGVNLVPVRPPVPPQPMMMPPQPFFMAPQPPQMIPGPYPGPPAPPIPGPPLPGPPKMHADVGEPPAKKMRGEESLIPEAEFMSRYPTPVTFRVSVPTMPDKPEWKLNGQMVSITLPLQEQVSVLKAKLNDELGMPPGKQKLQIESLFLKDSNTLAFYNIAPGMVVNLQLKERGGRKK